jgi:hypothetical protein
MPTRRRNFRSAFGAKTVLVLGLMVPSALAVPVVAPASGIAAGITAPRASLTATADRLTTTEPMALALLGSGLLGVAFLIRRLQS